MNKFRARKTRMRWLWSLPLCLIPMLLPQVSVAQSSWMWLYDSGHNEHIEDVTPLSPEGFAMAGRMYSKAHSSFDLMVMRATKEGWPSWVRTFGGRYDDEAFSVLETSDGGIVVAGHNRSRDAGASRLWVIKVASNGTYEWDMIYGARISPTTPDEEVVEAHRPSITETEEGFVVVAEARLSADDSDIWVLELDSDGSIRNQYTYGRTDVIEIPYDVQPASDGGVIIVGTTNEPAQPTDGLALRINSAGGVDWAVEYASEPNDRMSAVREIWNEDELDYNFIIAGTTYLADTDDDVWLLRINQNGDLMWQNAYGGPEVDVGLALTLIDDDVAVAGYSFSWGWSDIYAFRAHQSDGALTWQHVYRGSTPATFLNGATSIGTVPHSDGDGLVIAGSVNFFTQATALAVAGDGGGIDCFFDVDPRPEELDIPNDFVDLEVDETFAREVEYDQGTAASVTETDWCPAPPSP